MGYNECGRMKRQIAIVDWIDSSLHGTDEHSADDADLMPTKITSVGFIVKDRTKYIVLAMDRWGDGTYRSCETIVKSGITNIEFIKK
jgi:hypothetical protein